MPLAPGTRLGPYEIAGPLGAGGMGEVYRARDSKLGRDVALKVLPEAFAQDAARMARFEREAQVLAALNHPNIAAIYGIEQGALVMELVEGEDLKGPVPIEMALGYARQIATGLAAAHDKGIIHRDLKPANIKVTPAGVVKLLDFGLAKAAEGPAAASSSGTMSPTMSLAMTQAGVILGTAAYMSPEQARGKPVDKRADVWAFGVVLYEILAGRLLFGGGDTVTDTLASVVKEEPDWKALPAETPAHVRRLLERCLRKDPDKRLRDIGDARLLLEEPDDASPAARPRRPWLPWVVAGFAVALSLALLALVWFRPKPAEIGAVRFLFALPEGTTDSGSPAAPQIVPSPDGRYLAFIATDAKTGKGYLWVRALGSVSAQRLDKTEGASLPFWSPDGQFIAFFADQKLKKSAVTGGSPQTICDTGESGSLSGDGGTWNQAGVIVFSTGSGPLHRVAAAGGLTTPVTALDTNLGETGHSWPQFLTNGRHLLYFARSRESGKSGVYVQELGSSKRVLVLRNALRAAYSPPGYLLFAREGTLLAQRLDQKTFQLQGEAVGVAQEITANEGNGRAAFAVSGNGVLAYRGGSLVSGRQLAWYDREGKRLGSVGEPGDYGSLRLSPDEKYAALVRIGNRKGGDVWIMDLASGILTRATFDAKIYTLSSLAWSPDSQRLAASRTGGGVTEIVAASRAATDLSSDPNCALAWDWSADGRWFLCGDAGLNKITLLPLTPEQAGGGRKPQTLLNTPFLKFLVHFSPDGQALAYGSSESGEFEVYVASFPSFAEKRQVSGGGGIYPVWRKDGRELYFHRAGTMLMAAEVKTGPRIEVGIPKPLFKINLDGYGDQYAVTGDGKRFLVKEPQQGGSEAQITVVVNWMAEVKQ